MNKKIKFPLLSNFCYTFFLYLVIALQIFKTEGRGHGHHGGHSSTAHGVSIYTLHHPVRSTPPPPPPPPHYTTWDEYGESLYNNIKFGYATSAFQIEGAWNIDGKGPSVWDNFTHRVPSPIIDGSSGDITCNSYFKYKEDVKLLVDAKAEIYRFSISWPRILPNGTKESINPLGIAYYNNLINELIANNIEPLITLYHFDLPQSLEDRGGFLNESAVVQPFTDFAEIAFREFGDRVKRWITFNEPWAICIYGYEEGIHAPGVKEKSPEKGALACGHNILKAHANVYRLYESTFKQTQGGVVGITLVTPWFYSYPWLTDEKSKWKVNDLSARMALQEVIGWFAQPVMKGTYPTEFKEIYGVNKIPIFNSTWVEKLNGSADFLGLNHYTTFWVKDGKWHSNETKSKFFHNPAAPSSASQWLKSEPRGFRKLLQWVQKEYDNPPIYITENGFSDSGNTLHDTERINYLHSYIAELKESVIKEHINVQVYTIWSLLDNLEFTSGNTERFGVYYVNFTDPQRARSRKDSVSCVALEMYFKRKGLMDLYDPKIHGTCNDVSSLCRTSFIYLVYMALFVLHFIA